MIVMGYIGRMSCVPVRLETQEIFDELTGEEGHGLSRAELEDLYLCTCAHMFYGRLSQRKCCVTYLTVICYRGRTYSLRGYHLRRKIESLQ